MLKIKRVYDPPADSDGTRILIDRIWPRGLTKRKARVDAWLKDLAPSTELRKWFNHDPEKWAEFRRRYARELAVRKDRLKELRSLARRGTVTLVYAAHDQVHNNAVAILRLAQGRPRPRRRATSGSAPRRAKRR